MKELSCRNPKMAAYCHEVCKLKDNFDGLELNHIPRWLNEATNELVKMASGREPTRLVSSLATSTSLQSVLKSQATTIASRPLWARGLGTVTNHQP
jgi:hypothetical protein